MVVPLPETGVYPGWEDMGDGTMATRMSRFLQRDINEGRIFYKHKGNAALTDTVTFEVCFLYRFRYLLGIMLNTVNPLYNDVRYNNKTCCNVNWVCTKISRLCILIIDSLLLFFRKTYVLDIY